MSPETLMLHADYEAVIMSWSEEDFGYASDSDAKENSGFDFDDDFFGTDMLQQQDDGEESIWDKKNFWDE